MSARRYTVRLFEGAMRRGQEDLNLDPRNRQILRSTLERMVLSKMGTLDLDLSRWSLVVHSLGGGQIQARCRVLASGATEVSR